MDRRAFLSWLAVGAAGCTQQASARNEKACAPTQADVLGPFYVEGAPNRVQLAGPGEPGERLIIRGRVLQPDCSTPIANALLDVWQADASGEYHGAGEDYRLRGVLRTDASGRYELHTVRPGNYRQGSGFRPAHLHFTISAPGFAPVTTQMYFAGDPYLAPNDSCGSCGSDDKARIVTLKPEQRDGGQVLAGTFEVVLART